MDKMLWFSISFFVSNQFNPPSLDIKVAKSFVKYLPILGKGMLGLFLALGIISLSVILLNKISEIRRKRASK